MVQPKNTAYGQPVLLDTQIAATSTAPVYQPGTIFVWRGGASRAYSALAQYVQLDNNGCDLGNVLVKNLATMNFYSVKKSATTDSGCPIAGMALATIASQSFGFMAIRGYVEKGYVSQTCASGDYLEVSGSTAGYLTNNRASVFNLATLCGSGVDTGSGIPIIIGMAHDNYATGLGSMTLMGSWGV